MSTGSDHSTLLTVATAWASLATGWIGIQARRVFLINRDYASRSELQKATHHLSEELTRTRMEIKADIHRIYDHLKKG